MREKLAKLNGQYLSCWATVGRVSLLKGSWDDKRILLEDIFYLACGSPIKDKHNRWFSDCSEEYLEDHVWCTFKVYDTFCGGLSLDDLEKGNYISFFAYVKPYEKGHIGNREIDYTLTDFEDIKVISSSWS
jgi:hypothetical protein